MVEVPVIPVITEPFTISFSMKFLPQRRHVSWMRASRAREAHSSPAAAPPAAGAIDTTYWQ